MVGKHSRMFVSSPSHYETAGRMTGAGDSYTSETARPLGKWIPVTIALLGSRYPGKHESMVTWGLPVRFPFCILVGAKGET